VFGQTSRGNPKLLYGGYAYNKDRVSKTSSHWKCAIFTRYRCKARAVTRLIDGVEHFKMNNLVHYHAPNDFASVKTEPEKSADSDND
jgi:FLYWCH zinc finger domain